MMEGHQSDITKNRKPLQNRQKDQTPIINEAARRPTATLNELLEYLASTCHSLHVTAISHIHMFGI